MAPFDFRNPSTFGQMFQPGSQQGPDGWTDEERALIQAYLQSAPPPLSPPGIGQQIGNALQQVPVEPRADLSPWAGFGLGLLHGAGQGLSLRGERKQQEQAQRNQRNILATQAILQARAKRLGELSPEDKAYQERRGQIRAGPLPGTEPKPEARRALTDAEAAAFGLAKGSSMTLDEITSRREMLRTLNPNKYGGSGGSSYAGFDPEQVADGIVEGTLAPTSSGYSRGQWGAIATSLRKRGFDATRAGLEYQKVLKNMSTLQGRAQLQIRQSAVTVRETLDLLDQLNDELVGLVPRNQVGAFNRVSLGAARDWGALGPEAQNKATQIRQVISDLVPELANVYQAGGVPTESGLRLARENLKDSWAPGQLKSATALLRKTLQYRLNAIDSSSLGYGGFQPGTSDLMAPGQQNLPPGWKVVP